MNSHKGTNPPSGPAAANKQTGDLSSGTTDDAGAVAKTSGRVTFDSRGNSIWEWQTEEPGKFSREVSPHHLKQLEAPELSLEDASNIGKIERPEAQIKKGTGFNPYDRSTLTGDTPPAKDGAADPSRKPIKDLRRYNEWVKLKQRMADEKDDD